MSSNFSIQATFIANRSKSFDVEAPECAFDLIILDVLTH